MKYTDKQIERLIQAVYDGNLTTQRLPEDLYFAIANYLKKGVYDGFGGALMDFDGKPLELLKDLRENIYMFSAAKTYQEVRNMTDLLIGDDALKTFKEFKDAAMQIYDQYNKNWLRTEYDTAIGQAQSAQRWEQIEANADTLPLLQYSAVVDQNTSDICAPLDGIILPVGDSFWNTFAPLNHFNCRCTLIQLDEGDISIKSKVDEVSKQVGDDMNDVFKMNSGKDKYIFKDDHPYFDVAKGDKELARNNFNLPIPETDE